MNNYIKKLKRQNIFIKLLQFIFIILLIIIWELLAKYNVINSFIFSSPSRIIKSTINYLINNNLLYHIGITLKEILIAFILGTLLSFIFAIIMYLFPRFAKFIDPFITIFNSLPKVALGPIIIIWVGANTKSIITMALLINLIVSLSNIYNSFILTDPIKIKLLKSFKASKLQILYHLVIPSNYKALIATLKINISMTMIGVIMGEFLVSKAGIGYLIMYGTQIFNLDLVMMGITIILILSYLLYEIIVYIENIANKRK